MTLGAWLHDHRWLCLLAALALTGLLGSGLGGLRFDVSNESYFVEGDTTLVRYHELLETFGSDEVVYLLIEVEDGFSQPRCSDLLRLGTQLRSCPGVTNVRSPFHSKVPVAAGGLIDGVSLEDLDPNDDDALRAHRQRILAYRPFRGVLIDAKARHVGFLLQLESRPLEPNFRADVLGELRRRIARSPLADAPHAMVGAPVYAVDFAQIVFRESRRFLMAGLLVAFACLLLLFRRLTPTLAPFAVVLTSLVGTLGIMGHFGVPLSAVSTILVSLLICVGVADAMHLVSAFERHRRSGLAPRPALQTSVEESFAPCLLTSLTTGAGFLALVTSQIAPVRHLGVFAAVGCALGLLNTFALLPALLAQKAPVQAPRRDGIARGLKTLHRVLARRPRAWIGLAALLACVAGAGLPRLRVDHDFLAYLDPAESLRRDIEFVHQRMGGAVAAEIAIYTDRPDGGLSAQHLRALADYQRWAETTHPQVRTARSLVQGLEEAHVLFDGPRSLPASDEAAAQLFFVLQSVDPAFCESFLSHDGATLRLTLRMEVMSSQRYGHILNSLEAELQRRFKDARCHLTGGAVMIEAMKHHILRTQVESFALALAIISVVLLLAAGNLRLGVFAVAGNLGPIVVVLGVMGWCGIALEVSNILVATIAIGIVVDDTIHIIHGYRRERQSRGAGDDAAYEAVGAALASSGRAILFTTMVLSLTFAVYVGSSLSNIRDFGLLVVTTFVAALAADLIVLPALMLAWPPQGKGTA